MPELYQSKDQNQRTEPKIGCDALNRMTSLGMRLRQGEIKGPTKGETEPGFYFCTKAALGGVSSAAADGFRPVSYKANLIASRWVTKTRCAPRG